MTTVVLTVITAWLVLSVLATTACALVTRGGQEEDTRRQRAETDLLLLMETCDVSDVPDRRATVG